VEDNTVNSRAGGRRCYLAAYNITLQGRRPSRRGPSGNFRGVMDSLDLNGDENLVLYFKLSEKNTRT